MTRMRGRVRRGAPELSLSCNNAAGRPAKLPSRYQPTTTPQTFASPFFCSPNLPVASTADLQLMPCLVR